MDKPEAVSFSRYSPQIFFFFFFVFALGWFYAASLHSFIFKTLHKST